MLPIDRVVPRVKQILVSHSAAVLQAETGAGKTTRVPLALMDESWLAGQTIVMLEPRRLAAASAARYMAGLLGEPVGYTVGYTVRYERRVTSRTRIEVVTEGILTRRLQADPALKAVGLVIFDEFHERNLNSDLALALCLDAQQGLREDLKILVMSATLDGGAVSRLLGGAPVINSPGRSFPVTLHYQEKNPSAFRHAAEHAARAVRRVAATTEGDILVFLPGVADIRRCRGLLAGATGLRLCPLYGGLPFAEQQRAMVPGPQRRVVLATNIAETSLTIEGITTVVDSGLARRPRFDAAAGISRLETAWISAASAAQRAGRAGRLGPGHCYRLWNQGHQAALMPFTPPEIRQVDLVPLALELAHWGVSDADQLAWLDPPPQGALAAARRFLQLLGALDAEDRVTPWGKKLARHPTHPRWAALLEASRELGTQALGCDLAALLAEPDVYRTHPQPSSRPGPSDVLERLELLHRWRTDRSGASGYGSVERAARFWRQRLGGVRSARGLPAAETLAILLARACPDRIARQRRPGSERYLLANGRGARLSKRSVVSNAPFLVAVDMVGRPDGEGEIFQASAIEPAAIAKIFPRQLAWQREVRWDPQRQRVVARKLRQLGRLVLEERPLRADSRETVTALLDGLEQLGLAVLDWTPAARQFVARVQFLGRTFPQQEWPDLSRERLQTTAEAWLAPFLNGLRSRADLERCDPLPALEALFDWQQRRRLDAEAPERIEVPSGSRIRIDYLQGEIPVLAVKLQELFGLTDTPAVARGRVPLLLHLLSPAQRPVQVTRDLRSFWASAYPQVKKELKGRYPKHPWPDDPLKAIPTRHTRRRQSGRSK